MQLNSDFSRRVVVSPEQYHFVDAPRAGVSRMLLDRAGTEVAHATSIVCYAPGSGYRSHRHDGGEGILVLEGLCCDEYGQYPAGSWLRNPRYSELAPFTGPEGALIYVKAGHIDAGLLGDKFIQPESV